MDKMNGHVLVCVKFMTVWYKKIQILQTCSAGEVLKLFSYALPICQKIAGF